MGYAVQSPKTGSFTTTVVGTTTTPTNMVMQYHLNGLANTIGFWMQDATTGTGTTFTFTVPFASRNITNFTQVFSIGACINNGSFTTSPGKITIAPGSNIATCFTSAASAAWTGAGDRRVFVTFTMIIEP